MNEQLLEYVAMQMLATIGWKMRSVRVSSRVLIFLLDFSILFNESTTSPGSCAPPTTVWF